MTESNDTWNEWGKHVLKTLEKLDTKLEEVEKTINTNHTNTQVELATLKIQASLIGIAAGAIVSIAISLVSGFILYKMTESNKPQIPDPHPHSQIQQMWLYPPNKEEEELSKLFKWEKDKWVS